jgi:DNA-binding MarR family transcriptional regulator
MYECKICPSIQWFPSLSDLFKGKKRKERKAEDQTIYAAYVHYGYTMKEIAEHLGLHYATISRAIKRVERR